MGDPSPREQALTRFRSTIAQGRAVIGAGAGIGLSAKALDAGGIDFLVVYNSGRFRMAGHGSLAGLMPYGNANMTMLDMAKEVFSVVKKETPVFAGICATDPFVNMRSLLGDVRKLGFVGVQNFPTVGLIDGVFRQNLEETGMGYDKEVEMIKLAHEMDFLTSPYVFTVAEARSMAHAGADIIVAHMGLTTSGMAGAKTALTLDECVGKIKAIREAVVEIRKDIIMICHGGPIARPEDARYVLDKVKGVQGFLGASSLERLPVEESIKTTTETFKAISL